MSPAPVSPFTGGGGPSNPQPTGVSVISSLNNKCIDVPNASFVDSAPLQMWGCNNSSAQKWTFTGGTLQAGGKCMDVQAAGTGNGTPIQLYTCNGTAAQQFVLSGAGDLVNPQANKCVDIVDLNPNDHAQLQLWDCAGSANQKWRKG